MIRQIGQYLGEEAEALLTHKCSVYNMKFHSRSSNVGSMGIGYAGKTLQLSAGDTQEFQL
jgi:hypothetical protein